MFTEFKIDMSERVDPPGFHPAICIMRRNVVPKSVFLTRAPLGGDYFEPPSRFLAISS